MAARDSVVDVLRRVFAVHGAVPLDSAYVGSCPVDAPPDVAAMLLPSGARLSMRCGRAARSAHPPLLAPPLCSIPA